MSNENAAVTLPNVSSNDSSQVPAAISGAPVVTDCVIFLVVVALNGFTLFMFIRKESLRTPFGVYLMFLLSYNMVFSFMQNPLDVINNLFSHWILNSQWCSLYIYATYFVTAGSMHTHVLVTLNRVWAVNFASKLQTKKAAVFLCVCMFVYVHVILLPGFVLDAMYYRTPSSSGSCYLNTDAQQGWSITVQFVIYIVPEVIMLVAYPFIWYGRRVRKKLRQVQFRRHGGSSDTTGGGTASFENTESVGNRIRPAPPVPKRIKNKSHAFTVLTLLTFSVFITWTPQNIYFTVGAFIPLDYPVMLQITTTLYALQPALDPLFFIVALKDLRDSYRDFFTASICSKLCRK